MSDSTFIPLLQFSPRLYLKLQRPYLRNGLGTKDKLTFLAAHYQFLKQCFTPTMLENLASGTGVVLCEMDLGLERPFAVSLRAGVHEKEGDLSLTLADAGHHKIICAITFSVTSWGAQRELFIGGLQGLRDAGGKALVVDITRALYGLRPKSLLLFVLRKLASHWGIQKISAVNNSLHVCRRRLKQVGSSVNFDAFWAESGGTPDPLGLFLIPLTEAQRDIALLKPAKRSMYRKRYAMLSVIDEELKSVS